MTASALAGMVVDAPTVAAGDSSGLVGLVPGTGELTGLTEICCGRVSWVVLSSKLWEDADNEGRSV